MKKMKQYKPTSYKAGKKFNPKAKEERLYALSAWKEFSLRFLKENPHCYVCGRYSEVTDHIQAHKGDENLFWKIDNFIPLCFSCHNTITGLFDRHTTQRYREKLIWISRERIKNECKVTKVVLVPTGI
jgi:5-methylcytosine-specific restriction endonuclease McrA